MVVVGQLIVKMLPLYYHHMIDLYGAVISGLMGSSDNFGVLGAAAPCYEASRLTHKERGFMSSRRGRGSMPFF